MPNNRNLSFTILELIESSQRTFTTRPLNLGGYGGEGGGVGLPPGGFVGKLPQYMVTYDTTEAATLNTLPSGLTGASGWSLVDNLNHIRYRLNILESGGSITVVDDNNALTYSDVDTIHFSGTGVTVTNLGGGDIRVSISGGGGGSALTVQEYDGSPIVSNVDKIIFSGFIVTDLGSGDALVTASGLLGSNGQYIDQSGGTSDTYGVLSGSVNGSNAVFTVSQAAYISGSLKVYLNGQLQTQGSAEDWVETSPAAGTFTFATAPATGDLITVSYQKSVSALGNADTVDGYHASSFAQQSEFSSGWKSVSETWTYVSADDPVYQIYVSGDALNNPDYKLGNKIKCTNNSTTFYAFIVKVGAYDSGNNRTPVDLYGGTDYDLANSAITAPYVSKIKSPDGFSLNPTKWSVIVTDTQNCVKTSPTASTYYGGSGLSPTGPSIDIPIGCWIVTKDCAGFVQHSPAAVASVSIRTTLSTANNSETDNEFHSVDIATMPIGTNLQNFASQLKYKVLALTSKTTYYLNILTGTSGTVSIALRGDIAKTILKAVCAYL